MYTIGICDDEVFYREHIKKLCEQFFKNKGEECKYIEFVTGEEILNYDTEKIHLLFLDIEMPGLNGIEVLHEVENYECIWRIVFVSCHADMVWNSFSIKTLDFARKPVSYEQIDRWLSLMIRENQEDKMIYLENSNGLMSCKAEEVLYFQADRNYTLVYMKKEKYLLSGNMRSWEQKLNVSFIIRAHKSFLVNLQHIKKWSYDRLILKNNMEIPVGRKYADTVKKMYFEFLMNRSM